MAVVVRGDQPCDGGLQAVCSDCEVVDDVKPLEVAVMTSFAVGNLTYIRSNDNTVREKVSS